MLILAALATALTVLRPGRRTASEQPVEPVEEPVPAAA